MFLREGPESNLEGINRAEALVASTREQVGDDIEIAVDAWMSLNNEYAVRLAEALRPYRIKWLEDYLNPENLDGYQNLRNRIPWQTLATGEHWYSIYPFAVAASKGIVDIFQPDLNWVGGITAGIKICHIAEAHGLSVIPHASTNYPYGQHLAFSMPAVPWAERSEGVAPPGVPLEEMVLLPGTPVIKDGYIIASWGDTKRVDMTFSVTKSYLSAVTGAAVDRNLIRSEKDFVSNYVWDKTFDGEKNSLITWEHLLNQSSDWFGSLFGINHWEDRPDIRKSIDEWRSEPQKVSGTHYKYNDVRVNVLAYSLLQVFRESLPKVLKKSH